MIVAIQQPEHLPWMGFFNKMAHCDLYVYLDSVQFKKRYYENRNRLVGPNGAFWVTVPVQTKGRYHQRIDEVRICYDEDWQKSYLDTMRHCYGKAPFFHRHYEEIARIIMNKHDRLVDMNLALINLLRHKFGISTDTVCASEFGVFESKGSDLILDLCRKTNATRYISGPDGRRYLNLETFRVAGIDVMYHDYEHPVYAQRLDSFVSHMSVVDYLFNNNEKGVIRDGWSC
jgi:hypothetical protein